MAHSRLTKLKLLPFTRMNNCKFTSSHVPHNSNLNSGHVTAIRDCIVDVHGLQNSCTGDVITFSSTGAQGLVFALRSDHATVVTIDHLDQHNPISVGDIAHIQPEDTRFKVSVGAQVLGRVLNGAGDPIDGQGPFKSEDSPDKTTLLWRHINSKPPTFVNTNAMFRSLYTGIKTIDIFRPLQFGVSRFVLGKEGVGKTSMTVDCILNQTANWQQGHEDETNQQVDEKVVCVYVSIGQSQSHVSRIMSLLKERGAMAHTVIVSAPSSASVCERYLAPLVGSAIAEHFRDNGQHALVIYDDMNNVASALSELHSLVHGVTTAASLCPELLPSCAQLLEQACQLSIPKGRGTLTTLPILQTLTSPTGLSAIFQQKLLEMYQPSSVWQDHIYLDSDIYARQTSNRFGDQLPIRVDSFVEAYYGCRFQRWPLRSVRRMAELYLAQGLEIQPYVFFSKHLKDTNNLDPATTKQSQRLAVIRKALEQERHSPVPWKDMVVLMNMCIDGDADEVPPEHLQHFLSSWVDYVKKHHGHVMQLIATTGRTDYELHNGWYKLIDGFKKTYSFLSSPS